MKKLVLAACLFAPLATANAAEADSGLRVTLYEATAKGQGPEIGHVMINESPYGLVFTPELKNLPMGNHGFHVHDKPSCDPVTMDGKTTPAGAAGGHLDPQKTGRHSYPWDDKGHLGDLPALYVNKEGVANVPVLAPKLKKIDEVKGHALMVHVGHDNYSDMPEPLGGGGGRFACGVIK